MSGGQAHGAPGPSVYDRVAPYYDAAFALTAFLIRRIFRRHLPGLGVPRGGRILDMGCGTGSLALHLAREGHAVVGVDSSPVMVARARARRAREGGGLPLELLEADAGALPFEDGSFDLVTLVAVLHGPAAEGRRGLLAEARRLSRGIVLVHDYPPFPGPRGIFAPLLRLLERMERSDFDSFLRQGRLEMEAVFPSVTVLPVAVDSAWYICRKAAQPGGAG